MKILLYKYDTASLTISVDNPGCLSRIRIFFHPGASSKNLSILSSRKYDPGCSSRILIFTHPGSRGPDQQHCLRFCNGEFLPINKFSAVQSLQKTPSAPALLERSLRLPDTRTSFQFFAPPPPHQSNTSLGRSVRVPLFYLLSSGGGWDTTTLTGVDPLHFGTDPDADLGGPKT